MVGLIIFLFSALWIGCGDEAKLPDGTGEVATLLPPADVIEVRNGERTTGSVPPSTTSLDAGAGDAGAGVVRIVGLTGPASVTNGGTALLHVEVSPPIDHPQFVIWHDGDEGYNTVTGTGTDRAGVYDVGVRVVAEASQTSLVINVALLDVAGDPGPPQHVELLLIPSGTGDVKVTLSYDRVHDLDLHVIEPSGDEIYYQHSVSGSGGRLDLDSGQHCKPSPANSENIFWPSGAAPAGEYRVSVQNYEQCSPGEIAFTVTIEHDGVKSTFDGAFADGTAGETPTATNLVQITTFQHQR